MFKKYYEAISEAVREYFNFSLIILGTTTILIPLFFHIERTNVLADVEHRLSHIHKHLSEGTNPTPTNVLICEAVGCFGYTNSKGDFLKAEFGIDMQDSKWEKAKYHVMTPASLESMNIPWYQTPFITDIDVFDTTTNEVIHFKKNFYGYFIKDFEMFSVVQLMLLIISIYLFTVLTKKERDLYKSVSEKESSLLNNIMTIYITENLHHELLTPVKVIMTKNRMLGMIVKKEQTKLDETGKGMDQINLEKQKESIDYIELSVEQIVSVLENMRQSKMVKKGADQNIYDILSHTIKLMDIITTDEFEYHIDEELIHYELSNDLSTGSFLNIILNHIKNSVEANADSIIFNLEYFKHNILVLRMIDNGNGIPDKVLKKLFEQNNSSKEQNANSKVIRGNGLFLNKNILGRSGGDVTMVSTDELGTTFEIKVPAKKIEKVKTKEINKKKKK